MQGALPKNELVNISINKVCSANNNPHERDRRGEALPVCVQCKILKLFRFVRVWSYQSPPLDHHDVGFADEH